MTLKLCIGAVLLAATAHAVPHLSGPIAVSVGAMAELQVPEGYDWVEPPNIPAFLNGIQSEAHGDELGVLVHLDAPQFYTVFYFQAIGFWVDPVMTEQDKANLLEGYKIGTDEQTGRRVAEGHSSIAAGDWIHPPIYDKATHRRAWAVATTETEVKGPVTHVANLGFQVFGKEGAMRVIAACKPEEADAVIADLGSVLNGFAYRPGLRYEDAPPPDTSVEDARRAAGEAEKRHYMIGVPLVLASPFILAGLYVLLTGKHKAPAGGASEADGSAPLRRSQAAPSMDDPSPPSTPTS